MGPTDEEGGAVLSQDRDEPSTDEGGDAACWLANVCERCGAFQEAPGQPCWRCGGQTTPTGVAGS
jgi:hypothetical protein